MGWGIATSLLASAWQPALAEPYLDVVISELMYHAPGADAEREYVEITNRGAQSVNLADWRLSDGIEYTFPSMAFDSGDRLVIAKDPAAAEALYGITGVLGPYDGRLANGGERIEILNAQGGLVCEVDYDDKAPWPTGGDGDGRSIELTDLSRNGNVGRFWAPSAKLLGTPGATNVPGGTPPVTVVINEFLANSSGDDWIELYNYGDTTVDIKDYYLTDTPSNPTKSGPISASWSAGTTEIPAKGYWLTTQADWGFGLSSGGEQVYLVHSNQITWVDGCDFGNQPVEDYSEGRYPDADEGFKKMPTMTPGAANVDPRQSSIVIN